MTIWSVSANEPHIKGSFDNGRSPQIRQFVQQIFQVTSKENIKASCYYTCPFSGDGNR